MLKSCLVRSGLPEIAPERAYLHAAHGDDLQSVTSFILPCGFREAASLFSPCAANLAADNLLPNEGSSPSSTSQLDLIINDLGGLGGR